MMEHIITVKNLTKKYDDFIAVNDLSFDVNRGEIFGFLGPNGAGKTTTINMLIGMAKISSGNIYFNDKDLTKNIKKHRKLLVLLLMKAIYMMK
jgi:ABC-type multidrug transport system, ATPase component